MLQLFINGLSIVTLRYVPCEVYRKISSQQAGFGWHKDIATNGDITSITTIFGSAVFQIRPEGKDDCTTTCSIPLIPGSIVLLSGDSRWKWEHRILPSETSTVQSQDVGRISLVLGCRKWSSETMFLAEIQRGCKGEKPWKKWLPSQSSEPDQGVSASQKSR